MKSIRSLAAVVLLLVPASALAQKTAKQPASPQSAQPPQASQDWQSSPSTDPRGGVKTTQFTLAGKFIKRPGQGGPDRPTLVVNCNPEGRSIGTGRKLVSATLQVGMPLKIDYVEPSELIATMSYFPKVAVHYGLDNGKSDKDQWSAGADKTSATFPKDTLTKILRSHTVVLAMNSDAESEISVQFDLPDSTLVAQTCGINLRKK
jgi:hypothetical protein